MESSIIVYKSITVANRAKRLMQRENIEASIIQIPATFEIKGCNYAVKINSRDLPRALELAEKYRLKVRKHFDNVEFRM